MKFLLLVVVAIAVLLYLVEKNSFPVTYKVCDASYNDCSVIAKFKERADCETTNKKWGWYCDQTDKENIKCKEKESTFSTGFCD